MNESDQMQDLVCELPEELAIYKRDNGQLPAEMQFQPGYICAWNDRYFVHTRVVLPLTAIDNGVGFGLWVEISKDDFDRYLAGESDDEKYLSFEAKGMLANYWPGFGRVYGLIVMIKAINVEEKIYITAVETDRLDDVGLKNALSLSDTDQEKIELLRHTVMPDK